MLEHLCPYLPTFTHHPRDARFLGAPIDFVVFNGLFPKRHVTELTIAEVKSGNVQLNEAERSTERSTEKAIEKGKVNFEVLQLK